jgi:hypothetical protein
VEYRVFGNGRLRLKIRAYSGLKKWGRETF